jgi:serine protease Do
VVWRSGKRVPLSVTLGELPSDDKPVASKAGKGGQAGGTEAKLGMRLEDISPAQRERFSLGTTKGALVTGIAQGSPAEEAGLRPGDVITQVGDGAVASAADAQRLVQKLEGKPVRLRVVREGRGSFVLVRPAAK